MYLPKIIQFSPQQEIPIFKWSLQIIKSKGKKMILNLRGWSYCVFKLCFNFTIPWFSDTSILEHLYFPTQTSSLYLSPWIY